MGLRDGHGAGQGHGGAMRNNQDCQGNGQGNSLGNGQGKANNRNFFRRLFGK